MSVTFIGKNGDLNLSNGTASRLLRAIGYKVSEETSGSMTIFEARVGIEKAKLDKSILQDRETIDFLLELERIICEIQDSGGEMLEWY